MTEAILSSSTVFIELPPPVPRRAPASARGASPAAPRCARSRRRRRPSTRRSPRRTCPATPPCSEYGDATPSTNTWPGRKSSADLARDPLLRAGEQRLDVAARGVEVLALVHQVAVDRRHRLLHPLLPAGQHQLLELAVGGEEHLRRRRLEGDAALDAEDRVAEVDAAADAEARRGALDALDQRHRIERPRRPRRRARRARSASRCRSGAGGRVEGAAGEHPGRFGQRRRRWSASPGRRS